jgi:carboxymethylenebutenolidase
MMGRETILRDYLIEEYVEDYIERHLTRREALKRIGAVTGSLAMAQTILAACTPAPQTAAQPTATATTPAPTPTTAAATATAAPVVAGPTVSPNDPSILAEKIQFPGKEGMLLGYLARPSDNGTYPAVLVCHENRGLTEHIHDVTRRLAKSGYVGLAVDLLSREGGTDRLEPAGISGVLGNANTDRFVEDFQSGMQYLQTLSYVRGDRIGMVGFCFGGGITWRVATRTPELKAAVPFYGPGPALSEIPNITAPVLAIYGGNDQRINAGIPDLEAAMQQHNKTFEKIIYPGANHAFHNDTGANYNAEAARDAWMKTIAWFDRYLKA